MNSTILTSELGGTRDSASLPARRSPRGLSMTTLLFALAALLFVSTGDASAQRTAAVGNDTSKVEDCTVSSASDNTTVVYSEGEIVINAGANITYTGEQRLVDIDPDSFGDGDGHFVWTDPDLLLANFFGNRF